LDWMTSRRVHSTNITKEAKAKQARKHRKLTASPVGDGLDWKAT